MQASLAKVAGAVKPGEEFVYVFDLGDDWRHRCVVDTDKVDPHEVDETLG